MTNLNTVFSASVSMLNANLSLDVGGTIEHALKVEQQGVSPAFLGSTSMSQLLGVSDKKKLIREVQRPISFILVSENLVDLFMNKITREPIKGNAINNDNIGILII